MRMIVKYTKPDQIEGARLFDIAHNASPAAVFQAAQEKAGSGATVIDVQVNDGTQVIA